MEEDYYIKCDNQLKESKSYDYHERLSYKDREGA